MEKTAAVIYCSKCNEELSEVRDPDRIILVCKKCKREVAVFDK